MQVIKRAGARNETVVNTETLIATVHHFTEHDSTAKEEGYQFQTFLDFNDVSMEQLLILASQTIIIRARPKLGFRSLPVDQTQGMTIKVKDFLRTNKKVNPAKRAAQADKAVDSLNDEQLAALFEKISKKMQK